MEVEEDDEICAIFLPERRLRRDGSGLLAASSTCPPPSDTLTFPPSTGTHEPLEPLPQVGGRHTGADSWGFEWYYLLDSSAYYRSRLPLLNSSIWLDRQLPPLLSYRVPIPPVAIQW